MDFVFAWISTVDVDMLPKEIMCIAKSYLLSKIGFLSWCCD